MGYMGDLDLTMLRPSHPPSSERCMAHFLLHPRMVAHMGEGPQTALYVFTALE